MITRVFAWVPCTVGLASADPEECLTTTTALGTTPGCQNFGGTEAGATCPAGCQEKIDDVYSACGGMNEGGLDWDTQVGADLKTYVEAAGCGGAAQAVPAIFVATSMVVSHFLN